MDNTTTHLQSGAATSSKGFVTCFPRVPQAVGLYCSWHAAQARKGYFQKTYYKTFGISCRPNESAPGWENPPLLSLSPMRAQCEFRWRGSRTPSSATRPATAARAATSPSSPRQTRRLSWGAYTYDVHTEGGSEGVKKSPIFAYFQYISFRQRWGERGKENQKLCGRHMCIAPWPTSGWPSRGRRPRPRECRAASGGG